jgi:hypothetical protein
MFIKSTTLLRNLGTLLAIVGIATLAQTALGQSPSPPLPSGSLSLPRPDFHFRGEVGRTYLDSDPATFPQIVRPPKGAQHHEREEASSDRDGHARSVRAAQLGTLEETHSPALT